MPQPNSGGRFIPLEREVVTSSADDIRALILRQATACDRLAEDLADFRCLYERQHEKLLAQLRHEPMSTDGLPRDCCPRSGLIHQNVESLPGSGTIHEELSAKNDSMENMSSAESTDNIDQVELSEGLRQKRTSVCIVEKIALVSEKPNSLKLAMAMPPKPPAKSVLDECEWLKVWLRVHLKSVVSDMRFEVCMGVMILTNMVMMAFQLQLEGYESAYVLGLRSDEGGLSEWGTFFEVVEKLFTVAYLIELVVRLLALGRSYFYEGFNVFDMMIVVCCTAESFILEPLMRESASVNLSILRVVRTLRVFRVIKIMRVGAFLVELRILVRTIAASSHGLVVSMVLIFGVVCAGAILMVQLSHLFLKNDSSLSFEKKEWLYESFGTTARAAHTMFECTFSSAWRLYSRPCIEDISSAFALFWVAYVVCVNFTVMRVVGSLFLKQTLAVAAIDKERQAMEKMKEKERFAAELHEIFVEGDTSKDGAISKPEFEAMIENEFVLAHFTKLDLVLDEVVALFGVLSADDGKADYQEFLLAAMKMKGSAQVIDTVQVLHQQFRLQRSVDAIAHTLGLNLTADGEARLARQSITG